jgi:hypothetical protein
MEEEEEEEEEDEERIFMWILLSGITWYPIIMT